MSGIVLLDTSPLGLIVNPFGGPVNEQALFWLRTLPSRGMRAAVSELADYELRRELIRIRKTASLRRLDDLKGSLLYVPITTEVMLRAADLWATARQQGRPTAANDVLDGDVIIAAQALILREAGEDVVIATTNAGHLAHFVHARHWTQIS